MSVIKSQKTAFWSNWWEVSRVRVHRMMHEKQEMFKKKIFTPLFRFGEIGNILQ